MAATALKPARDLRFDSLRGLMLVCMTVNHLPSSGRFLTDKFFGIFSSAEGFVFLSGIMAGWVYTRRRRRDGSEALWKTTRGRATMIYRWQMVSFIGALASVRLTDALFGFCSQNSPLLFYAHPLQSILLGSLLLYQPGMLDILPMYCAVVVALPWVLDQLEAGRRRRVFCLCAAAWLLVQFAPPTDGGKYFPIVLGSFNVLAWQFIFFIGVLVGHARATPGKDILPFRPLLTVLALALSVYGWGIIHLNWSSPFSPPVFGVLLNKPSLGLIRLADFLGFAYLVAILGKHAPKLLTWKPLALLGQHSIVVFALQSVVGITLCEFDGLFSTPLRNWASTAGAVALLWVYAGVHQAWQDRTARKVGAAPSPGPMTNSGLAPRHDLNAA